MADEEDWVAVAATGDVADGVPKAVETMGLLLALYRVGDEWFCTDNVCTHAFALLTEGWLEDYVIECPLHAGQFDVRDGKGLGAPIMTDLRTYAVRIEGDAVMIRLP
ncbi:MAG: non-heme iron oxygenase ferredoxin subunit [Acetobacteraceae bacterium]